MQGEKKGGHGKRKIANAYINDHDRRRLTFVKRKAGIMKKALELSTMTGCDLALVIIDKEAQRGGGVLCYATGSLKPVFDRPEVLTVVGDAAGAIRWYPENNCTKKDEIDSL